MLSAPSPCGRTLGLSAQSSLTGSGGGGPGSRLRALVTDEGGDAHVARALEVLAQRAAGGVLVTRDDRLEHHLVLVVGGLEVRRAGHVAGVVQGEPARELLEHLGDRVVA